MRDGRTGRFKRTATARERFVSKCQFNPVTGCVEWIGARTRGQGHTAWYGSFWYNGRSILAHRWAAEHIHGQPVSPDVQVDHECRNTLCQHHLTVVTPQINRELQWIRVQVGLDPDPEPYIGDPDGVPFYYPPEWLNA